MSTKPNPYLQGMEAARQGKPASANPYPRGRTDWTRWRGGWSTATNDESHYQAQEARLAKAAKIPLEMAR